MKTQTVTALSLGLPKKGGNACILTYQTMRAFVAVKQSVSLIFLSKLKLNSIRPKQWNETLLLSYAIMIHLRKQSYWTVHDGWLTAAHPKTQQQNEKETSLNAINLTVSAQYK